MLSRLKKLYRIILRYPVICINRRKLKNKAFTVISKDCTGALLLHELGVRFDTPTINACFHAVDFVKFCRYLKYYILQELKEDKENSLRMNYPVGILGDEGKEIRVWFMHYGNFGHAKAKWDERKSRIHWDNIFIIMTDGEGSNEETAREFDSLPYEHKILLTYRNFPDVKSAVKMKVKKLSTYGLGVPDIFAYKSFFSGKCVIDDWDYVSFFNSWI